MRRIVRFSVFLMILAIVANGQQHPSDERGYKPELAYQFNALDSVNLFNGNPIMTVPIASSFPVSANLSYSFVLHYSGNIWLKTEVIPPSQEEPRIRYRPQRDNAGMGWRLSFGELENWYNDADQEQAWLYRSPDAAEHRFYDTLHDPECSPSVTSNCDPVTSGMHYTRDATYLRMKDVDATVKIVEFPNGQRQRFADDGSGGWRLEWIYDAFSLLNSGGLPTTSFVRFEYPASTQYADISDWKLTDSHGRIHYVRFKPMAQAGSANVVKAIELAAFGETVATYDLVHEVASIPRPCDNSEDFPSASTVSILTSIGLPLGQTFLFDYDRGGGAQCSDTSGTITQATLPTLGKIEWSYRTYNFAAPPFYDQTHGVSERRVYDASGTQSQWQTYTGSTGSNAVTTCVPPFDGTCRPQFRTINYFQATWDAAYGLPYTTVARGGAAPNPDGSSSARLLSMERLECDPAAGTCPATPDRATYVKFEMDAIDHALDNCLLDYSCYRDRNRRVFTERTLYVPDQGRFADVLYTSFDGLGHYRGTNLSGNFGQGDFRNTFTDFNSNTRSYDPATWTGSSVGVYSLDANGNRQSGYTMLGANDSWILGTYTSRSTEENGVTASQRTCFDPRTGFLHRTRTLEGDGVGGHDLLSVFTPELGTGNLARDESFGGDRQTLSFASLCTMSLPAHDSSSFRVDHTYQYGSLTSSTYWDPTTQALMSFKSVDNTIDRNTGNVSESRDTAGVSTLYSYDVLGRLTAVTPTGVVPTTYAYTNATPTTAAQVEIAQIGASGTIRSQIQFDALGRVWRNKRLMPDGSWSTRETRYNAMGSRDRVSELETAPTHFTVFSDYDALGRARTITSPDAKATTISYSGVRVVARTRRVGTAPGVETDATTTETYDRQGRLYSVVEPEGNSTTTYSYDVGNRVASVSMTAPVDGTPTTQLRTFTYDRRGFLVSEMSPEVGTTTYDDYDARGHPGSRLFNGANDVFDLKFFYDAAQRLERVDSRSPYTPATFRTSKEFIFAGSNIGSNLTKGKLETAVRHNYQLNTGIGLITVTESYEYNDTAGRMTDKYTEITGIDSSDVTPQRTHDHYIYNDVDEIAFVDYPVCLNIACMQPNWTRIGFSYDAGALDAVTGFATSTSYSPSGLVSAVAHLNPVTDEIDDDDNGFARPKSITFSGVTYCDAPEITDEPDDQQILYGSTATFTVAAAGTSPIAYQWLNANGQPISGATSATYTTPSLTQTASYSVRVTNGCGHAVSRVATATVVVLSHGDFNADGKPDIVFRNYSTGQNALWLMNGTALSSVVDLPGLTNLNYRIEGTADFNSDGETDILLRNYATGQNALWLMNGTALSSIVDLPGLGDADYHFEGTGDFNADNKPDIILRNYVTGQNALWLMNGTAISSIVNLPGLADVAYKFESSGDFNGDGKPDIVLRNYVTGQNAVWLMNGTVLIGVVDLEVLPNTAYRFDGVADFNTDGKPDIVLRNYMTGQNAVWIMNGAVLMAVVDLPGLPDTSYEINGPR